MRKLSNTPLQIEVRAAAHRPAHESTNVSAEHLETFYDTFDARQATSTIDGLIITGAPVELHDVRGRRLLGRAVRHHGLVDHQRALHAAYLLGRAGRHLLPLRHPEARAAGEARPACSSTSVVLSRLRPLVRGFDDRFRAPHSRYTERARRGHRGESALGDRSPQSDEAGVYIAKSTDSRHFFVFGHPEYDTGTLRAEYERDVNKGMDVPVPAPPLPQRRPRARADQPPWRDTRAAAGHELAERLRPVPGHALGPGATWALANRGTPRRSTAPINPQVTPSSGKAAQRTVD